MKSKPTKGKYRLKQEAGLVPHRYDRDTERFQAGAWRHWPIDRMSHVARGMERIDRQILQNGREARGCIS